MPISYTIDTERGIIFLVGNGVIEAPRLREADQLLHADPAYHKGYHTLADMRRASLRLGFDGNRESRDYFVEAHKDYHGVRWAIVVANRADFGQIRQFELMAEGRIPVTIRGYLDIEEATKWLTEK